MGMAAQNYTGRESFVAILEGGWNYGEFDKRRGWAEHPKAFPPAQAAEIPTSRTVREKWAPTAVAMRGKSLA